MIVEPNKFFSELFTAAPNIADTNVSVADSGDYVGRYGERAVNGENGTLYFRKLSRRLLLNLRNDGCCLARRSYCRWTKTP